MTEFLYRGVSIEFYEKLNGELRPKELSPFARRPKWGKAVWGNSMWGELDINGVIEHQLHQAGYPTSGVSTLKEQCSMSLMLAACKAAISMS
jgi:hypothetical protein